MRVRQFGCGCPVTSECQPVRGFAEFLLVFGRFGFAAGWRPLGEVQAPGPADNGVAGELAAQITKLGSDLAEG